VCGCVCVGERDKEFMCESIARLSIPSCVRFPLSLSLSLSLHVYVCVLVYVCVRVCACVHVRAWQSYTHTHTQTFKSCSWYHLSSGLTSSASEESASRTWPLATSRSWQSASPSGCSNTSPARCQKKRGGIEKKRENRKKISYTHN